MNLLTTELSSSAILASSCEEDATSWIAAVCSSEDADISSVDAAASSVIAAALFIDLAISSLLIATDFIDSLIFSICVTILSISLTIVLNESPASLTIATPSSTSLVQTVYIFLFQFLDEY